MPPACAHDGSHAIASSSVEPRPQIEITTKRSALRERQHVVAEPGEHDVFAEAGSRILARVPSAVCRRRR
jgi:hypothetical protein